MLTTDNYETWDLYKSIPSLEHEGKTVFDETLEFNEKHKSLSMARLVDRRRAKVRVTSMGFSMPDRFALLKLVNADEEGLGDSCITDQLPPGFFETEFWYIWVTTFAFQPWRSAVEFRRYLRVKRTVDNQYDSLVRPLQSWLIKQGVLLVGNCEVTELDHKLEGGEFVVTGIRCLRQGKNETITVNDGGLLAKWFNDRRLEPGFDDERTQ
jgi:oleate hydratase